MFHQLSKFDMISPRYELKFKGNDGYKTPLGSFFTLLSFAITFFSIRNIISDFANRTNPYMSIQNFSVDETSTVSATSIPIQISFEIAGGDRNKVSLIDFPAPTISYVKQSPQNKTSNTSSSSSSSSSISTSSPPKKNNDPQMLNCTFSNGTIDINSFCLDSNQTVTFDSSKFSFDPSRVSNTSNTYVMIVEYTELRYNVSNYEIPYFFGGNKEFIFVESNKNSLRELLFIKKSISIQDTGFIYYNQRVTADYYQLEEVKLIYSFDLTNSTDSKKAGHDVRFTIKTTGDSISISYITFDDLLSAFGGTFGSIFYIIQIIYSNICEYFMNTDLINVIFKFHTSGICPEILPNFKVAYTTENNNDQNNEQTRKPLEPTIRLKIERKGSKGSSEQTKYNDQFYLQRKLFEREFEDFQSKKNLFNSRSEEEVNMSCQYKDRDDLGNHLKSLVKILDEVGKTRKPYYFSCCQYFIAKSKRMFRLGELFSNEKILLAAESVIETKMSYEFLAKTLNEIQSIKHCILDKELQCFVAMPSLNVNSETSIYKLNQFLLNSIKDESQEEISYHHLLEVFSSADSWKKRKTQRLFKNFTKSLF